MIIKFEETDLASRGAASIHRSYAIALGSFIDPNPITFDLSNVKMMTGSYADELFGILYFELGDERFYKKIKIVGASDDVMKIIAKAVSIRGLKNAN